VDRNGTASYTYDTLNRLIEAVSPLPTNPLESYNYDEVGNRVNSNQNGASAFNQANQLLEDASFTYQYDNNGNLTRKTNKVTLAFTNYEYDAENKLARVVSNGTVADYRYDGLGRRVEKQVTQGPTTNVTRYIYDNEDILLELDGSNNLTARYTHGPGIDEPLIMEKGGASFFYHADGLGSVTELTNSSGTVVQSYTYSSFGKIESQVDPNFVQPYTFTSREFDPETGLYFYRARYYDSSSGRFLQQDPIGFAGGSTNLYKYVGNNPVNWVDPTGLVSFGCFKENFAFAFSTTNDFFFGDITRLTRTAIGALTSGAVARTTGFTSLGMVIRALVSGSRVANLTIAATVASVAANALVNGVLVAGALEAGIIVGSALNATAETFILGSCPPAPQLECSQ